MGSNGTDEVMVAAVDEAECSDTTVEIKIKTLDSQTYTLRVNKRVPVPELKEQIETVTGVVSNQQRLICRGKVLKDDQLLSAYHVEDGHTLHLVVRQPIPPPSTSTMGFTGSESLPDHPASDPAAGIGQTGVSHRVLLGSFNIADPGDGNISDITRLISAVLGSIGIAGIGGGTEGSEQMEPGSDRLQRTSGSSESNQPQHDQPTARVQFDPLHGAFGLPTTAPLEALQPPVIPDSLTTLLQYLSHLRHEFTSIGGVQSSVNGEQEQTPALSSDVGQVGLPTAASLAEVMLSTRQLLTLQAGERLSELARQLQDQANLTSPLLRNSIQATAMRMGIALQNLGTLLLELGRTTMTLRMGQTPSEAVVNAGPAVFISTSGPNPIMVQSLQPGAGFGASSMGAMNTGPGLLAGAIGSGMFPRNIDIRIRAGPSTSAGNVNQGGQISAQQSTPQTGPERAPNGTGSVHQQGPGVSRGASFEAGVRVLPLRTVVAAVPAVGRPAANSSGSSMGLFYPLLARVQHVASGQSNDARGAQASGGHNPAVPETDYQRNPDSAMQQNASNGAAMRTDNPAVASFFPTQTTTAVSDINPAASIILQIQQQAELQIPNLQRPDAVNAFNTQQSGQPCHRQESAMQTLRSDQLPTETANSQRGNNIGTDAQDTSPRFGTDEGIFLSRLLHQIMPIISQTSVPETNGVHASENGNSQQSSTQTDNEPCAGTSRPRDDHPETSPSSKRQKKE
ncbi:Ubiquitin-like domain-containing protein cip73 [Thalictrum thalictroides]|uniref:Ubiquitin-like domain-containing protein cip73 n=1 Tax=Thalictrum thalictroides TaxID=46969 RepID=A0A7J6V3B3_THATH|nr:Ubiquitin-like domain-containing protein cip73 [Thalictrum thalictroides]